LWFASALTGIFGYIAWHPFVELITGNSPFRSGFEDARQAARCHDEN
jgi:hypothetical protein